MGPVGCETNLTYFLVPLKWMGYFKIKNTINSLKKLKRKVIVIFFVICVFKLILV